MKTIGTIATIVILIGVLVFSVRYYNQIPKGYILVSQKSIDSINAIAASIPDTIEKHDTIWPDPKIKWFARKVTTKDTLKDENVQIFFEEDSTGYQLLKPNTKDSIWITKKVPVIIQSPCVEKKWFLNGGIGVNGFIVSGEIGRIYKNRTYSIEVEYVNGKPFYKLKTGIKF